MRFFVGYILEYLSYFLFFGAFFFWTRSDGRGVIKILTGYYFLVGLLIFKATHVGNTKDPNLELYSLLCLLTSFCIGAYFFTILIAQWKKALIIAFCLLNGAYYLFNNVIGKSQKEFDSLAYVVLSSTLVILIFIFLHQLMANVNEEPLSLNFDFWFASSQLIYFSGSFLIFLTFGYLTRKAVASSDYEGYSQPLTWLWGIHNVLLFLSAVVTIGSIAWIYTHRK